MVIADGPASAGQEHRYQQAVAVLAGLDPLIASFAQRVKESGKWPMARRGDADTPVPDTLHTGGHPQGRHLSVYHDGTWLVHDLVPGAGDGPTMIAKCTPGQEPQLIRPLLTGPTEADVRHTMEHPQFGLYMDAVAEAPQWVPCELARYLSENGIAAPR